MTADQMASLRSIIPKGTHLERFPFEEYPSYFNIAVGSGEYAWKPVIIWKEMQKSDEPICWMDAGNVVLAKLLQIRWSLAIRGFFSPRSAGTIGDWTHPGMLAALGLPPGWGANLSNLSGGCIAFDPRKTLARQVAAEWASFAQDKNCIAPTGSSRENHRQDQALLTVLAYRAGLMRRPNGYYRYSRLRREFLQQQDILPEAALLAEREIPQSMKDAISARTIQRLE
jgi:hypothetical protein